MFTRRMVFYGTAGLMAAPASAGADRFQHLEAAHGGRLGIAALDTASGKTLTHRADERFAMCSTFKFLLAAAVLNRIDAGKEDGKRLIAYEKRDLIPWSPVTERQAGAGYGLSIGALIEAILLYSDNTAANLLLNAIGGPAAWTEFARSIGDQVSRLDRNEPELNTATPGDDRDTTTPSAMLADLQRVLTGQVLRENARRHLIDMMANNTTGARRLKAGLPKGWRIADKTGSGANGTRNDIGIILPPGRAPILAAVYYTGSSRPDAEKEAVLASTARLIATI